MRSLCLSSPGAKGRQPPSRAQEDARVVRTPVVREFDLYRHPSGVGVLKAMQALAMTNGGADTGSQQPLKAGNVRKAGGAQKAGSWVSFGTQAPLGVEAASRTTEKPAAARRGSPNAENAALSACGPIRAQSSKRRAAQASAGDKILKAERGDSPGAKSASCWMNWSCALTACRGPIWRSCERCSWPTSFYRLEPEIWVSAWVSKRLEPYVMDPETLIVFGVKTIEPARALGGLLPFCPYELRRTRSQRRKLPARRTHPKATRASGNAAGPRRVQ